MRDLVLVGGGHTHVQVLRRFAMEPLPSDVRVTVVLDRPVAMYSGMVPGFVARQYRRSEIEIDVRPLARRARARVIGARATAIDPNEKTIELEGRAPIPYDVASVNVGSTVAGLDVPGVKEHALPTRPIGDFVRKVDDLITKVSAICRLVVVGAGAAGVELAFVFHSRIQETGVVADITLVESSDEILSGYAPGVIARVRRNAKERGIKIRTGLRVDRVERDFVHVGDEEPIGCDAVAWVVGAAAPVLMGKSELPLDSRGFVRVRSTLQVVGHDDLFAVGDCATLDAHPGTPKAGVYAVREGPYLIDNLRAHLEQRGSRLRSYRPQGDFLTLLNLGDGSAVGSKWGRAFEGPWVFRLKDWIDRRFMRKFQVLADDGTLAPDFPEMSGMDGMVCGGCAAKVGQSGLSRALARIGTVENPDVVLGLNEPDDAAAVRVDGNGLLVTTVDAFRAFTDDPFVVGAVAAVNAASDLWAKGVTPRYAQALVTVEQRDPVDEEETLFQVMSGARSVFDEHGITLVGGHSTTGSDLAVGFSLWGISEESELLPMRGLRSGDKLVLTKPLGTGVLFHADMRSQARGEWIDAALASMLQANAEAGAAARAAGARACTDITGFGLAGHLGEMLRASGVSAKLRLSDIPMLPGVRELLERGQRSTFHSENAKARKAILIDPALNGDSRVDVLFDPQTSGGLLFGIRGEIDTYFVIGEVVDKDPSGALFSLSP